MCLSVSSGADGTIGITGVLQKKIPTLMEVRAAVGLHPNHSLLMPVNEPTWPHSTSSTRESMR